MRHGKPNRHRVQDRRAKKTKRCRHYSNPKKLHEDHWIARAAAYENLHNHGEHFKWWKCAHCNHWHTGRDHDDEFPHVHGTDNDPYNDQSKGA